MSGGFEIRGRFRCFFAVQLFGNLRIHNIGTKCNSLTQQFIGISTTIDTWATCFDSYRVIFKPSKTTDPIITRWSSALWDPQCLHNSIVTIQNYIIIIIIIIGIQPSGRSGQRPELSQSTDIAPVRCILDKFLGVVCHCFPPRLDVPTFATRCFNDARDPSGGRWKCGRECCPVILPK